MTFTARNADDFRAIFHDDFGEALTPGEMHRRANIKREKNLALRHDDEWDYGELTKEEHDFMFADPIEIMDDRGNDDEAWQPERRTKHEG